MGLGVGRDATLHSGQATGVSRAESGLSRLLLLGLRMLTVVTPGPLGGGSGVAAVTAVALLLWNTGTQVVFAPHSRTVAGRLALTLSALRAPDSWALRVDRQLFAVGSLGELGMFRNLTRLSGALDSRLVVLFIKVVHHNLSLHHLVNQVLLGDSSLAQLCGRLGDTLRNAGTLTGSLKLRLQLLVGMLQLINVVL